MSVDDYLAEETCCPSRTELLYDCIAAVML